MRKLPHAGRWRATAVAVKVVPATVEAGQQVDLSREPLLRCACACWLGGSALLVGNIGCHSHFAGLLMAAPEWNLSGYTARWNSCSTILCSVSCCAAFADVPLPPHPALLQRAAAAP